MTMEEIKENIDKIIDLTWKEAYAHGYARAPLDDARMVSELNQHGGVCKSDSIDILYIPQRAKTALRRAGARTLGDILLVKKRYVRDLRGMGEKSFNALVEFLHSHKFYWTEELFEIKSLREADNDE